MPFYEVHHSFPLSSEQRQKFASTITELHCSAFTTPSFFVHVRFIDESGSDNTYFNAGKPRTNSSNRVVGIVRMSPKRSKSDFDELAAKIEQEWYHLVSGSIQNAEKRLLLVMFTPMITIREGGMAIPEAGQEGSWLNSQVSYFKEMGEKREVKDFQDMLHELQHRPDLKQLLEHR